MRSSSGSAPRSTRHGACSVPTAVESSPHHRRAFERLYRRHRAEIHRFLARELGDSDEADDVTQEAFLNAFGALSRGGSPTNPRAWLYAIADNARRRRYTRGGSRPSEVPLDEIDEQEAPEVAVEPGEIVRALDRLPPAQRRALVLREVAGLSYREVAERLETTEAAVQMLIFRGRRTLRAALVGRGALVLLPLQRLMPWFAAAESPLAATAARAAAVAAAAMVVAVGVTSAGAGGSSPSGDRWRPQPAVRGAGAVEARSERGSQAAVVGAAVRTRNRGAAVPDDGEPAAAAGAPAAQQRSQVSPAAPAAGLTPAPLATPSPSSSASSGVGVLPVPVGIAGPVTPAPSPAPAPPAALPLPQVVPLPVPPAVSVPSVGG
jgi:RNA polymerase sigma-70 factor (ECF subfamily)